MNVTWQFGGAGNLETVSALGERVFKKGKIFQCGSYPDKGITVDQDAFAAANDSFAPVPINIEHWPTVLDGRLGELLTVETASDGAVYGLVAVPKELDDLIGQGSVPVSVEIDPETMRVVGLALAKSPRVYDAAIFSNLGVKHHVRQGETMTRWKEFIKAAFSKAVEDMPDESLEAQEKESREDPREQDSLEAQVKAEREAREKAEQDLAELKARQEEEAKAREQAQLDAASQVFAEEFVAANKILPSQADAVALQYRTALRVDNHGKACFADGRPVEGDCATSLRALLDAQPAQRWTQEMAGTRIIPATPKPGDAVDEQRKVELLGMSTLGRQTGRK